MICIIKVRLSHLYNLQGRVLLDNNDYVSSISYLLQSIELYKYNNDAWKDLTWSYYYNHDIKNTLEILNNYFKAFQKPSIEMILLRCQLYIQCDEVFLIFFANYSSRYH